MSDHHDQFDKQIRDQKIVGLTGFENQEIRTNSRHKIGEYLAYQKPTKNNNSIWNPLPKYTKHVRALNNYNCWQNLPLPSFYRYSV